MREHIKELGRGISVSESIRTLCPWCESSERSFSITRTSAGLLYNCYRATCGKHGIVGDIPPGELPAEKRKSKLRTYHGSLVQLGSQYHLAFFERFGITPSECAEQGIRYADDIRRIYFPIYDYRSFQIGENLRSIDPNVKPKALINRWTDGPLIHWPLGQTVEEILVLVEDQISAIKAAKVMPTAALLGTNLTEEGLSLFHKIGIKKIILMLDGDEAGRKATFELYDKLKSFFEVDMIFLPKGKDPKDLPLERLRGVLHGEE